MTPNELYELAVGRKVRLTAGLHKGGLVRKCHGYWAEVWEHDAVQPRAWMARTFTHIQILSARPELVIAATTGGRL